MRRRRHERAEQAAVGHVDDWLMTYADMITLLVCFFAVLLALSMPKKEAPVATASIAPASRQTQLSLRIPGERDEPRVEIAEAAVPRDGRAPREEAARPDPEAPVAEIIPPAFDAPIAQSTDIEPAGDRITTLEISSAAFFDSGSASLRKAGEAILHDVAAKLASDALRDYRITVEGHTDDAPIATARFPSNWELSTARAAAVVHYFLDQGIPAQRLRAAGYADTFPKVPNRDARGNPIPENQMMNRRVVIKLEKIEKSRRDPPAAIAG